MKRSLKITALALCMLFALAGLTAGADIVTIDEYEPKVDKLTIQTTNRVIPEGNDVDKYIEDYLGVSVDWIILGGDELRSKLNLLAASSQLPDVISLPGSLSDVYYSFIDQGLLVDIEPLLDAYAPNVYANRTEAQIEALRHTDGTLYAINSNSETDFDMMLVRADWLEALGLEVPATLDEFTAMLRAFKGLGDDIVPMYAYSNILASFSPIWAAFGANPSQWIWLEDGTIGYGATQPQMADALTYLQGLYAEGLISASYVVDGLDKAREAVSAGKTGAVEDQLWYVDPQNSMYHTLEGMDWMAISSLEAEPGKGGGYLTAGNPIVRQFTCITVDSKDPALAALYLNMLGDMDVYTIIRVGWEGVHYEYNEKGLLVQLPEFKADNNLLINNGITATYAMPFLPQDPLRVSYEQTALDCLQMRRMNEPGYYAAMYWSVPAILDQQLNAGMSDYVLQVLNGVIMDAGKDAAAELAAMNETLLSTYHLAEQVQLVNDYARTLGYLD